VPTASRDSSVNEDGSQSPPGKPYAAPEVSVLAGSFPELEILELLGQGGMGAVYKARQRGLDRVVALKILPPEAGHDPSFSERFTREARTLARLHHQNIVTLFEFGQREGLCYLIMEYVDGLSLRQLIRAGKLQPQEALKIVPQICDALQFAHDEGVVHRDIKPENILLDKRGRVKIADFGIAKMLGRKAADFTLTGPWQVVGTMHYMAPEQMDDPLHVDHRADIYSLGVVFYEMLTGELPRGRFLPPSQKVQIDVRLDEVVLHALEVQPDRRYQHASEVKTDVESISATREKPEPAFVGAGTAQRTVAASNEVPSGGAWAPQSASTAPFFRSETLDLDRCFRDAIAIYKKNLLFLVLAAFLYEVLSIFSLLILCGPLSAGICLMTIRAMRRKDKTIELGDMFVVFSRRFGRFIGLFFLTMPAILVATLCCLFPGLLLSTLWLFPFYVMVDADVGVFQALQTSQTIVTRKGFGMNLLLALIAIALELGPHVVPYAGVVVGWFVAPLAWLILTSAYIQQVHEDKGDLKDLFESGVSPSAKEGMLNPAVEEPVVETAATVRPIPDDVVIAQAKLELEGRRKGLADALNAHDKEAVKSFIDPSYLGKTERGKVIWTYWQLMDEIAVIFHSHPEYKQSFEIESIDIQGDVAKVTTRRVESMYRLWVIPWNNVSRWVETWKGINGQWMAVEEQLSPDQS
jgi:predicted Ser/Thr protein kinase